MMLIKRLKEAADDARHFLLFYLFRGDYTTPRPCFIGFSPSGESLARGGPPAVSPAGHLVITTKIATIGSDLNEIVPSKIKETTREKPPRRHRRLPGDKAGRLVGQEDRNKRPTASKRTGRKTAWAPQEDHFFNPACPVA